MKTFYSLLAIGILSMFSMESYAQNLWTGATSTNWNTASNWNNNILPGTNTQVTIPATAPNWPTYNGDLTVGTTCRRITMVGSSELTVTGNLTISAGLESPAMPIQPFILVVTLHGMVLSMPEQVL